MRVRRAAKVTGVLAGGLLMVVLIAAAVSADVRFVLRAASGAPLNSTSFTPEPVIGSGGRITSLTLRGNGYGHGVGMCQWGAIGRARAGQDFRAILGTYYPGTAIEPLAS